MAAGRLRCSPTRKRASSLTNPQGRCYVCVSCKPRSSRSSYRRDRSREREHAGINEYGQTALDQPAGRPPLQWVAGLGRYVAGPKWKKISMCDWRCLHFCPIVQVRASILGRPSTAPPPARRKRVKGGETRRDETNTQSALIDYHIRPKAHNLCTWAQFRSTYRLRRGESCYTMYCVALYGGRK